MSVLVGYLLVFVAVGIFFVFFHLMLGKLVRPARPHAEKLTIYECGEPTIGSSWIQFDVRFYVVALLFVIFDVEVAFFFPWAAVFGKVNRLAGETESVEARQQIVAELLPPARDPQTGALTTTAAEPAAATRLGWLAFGDILIFFGVLIVGFAYLWRRGDLNWVRSLAAERAGPGVAGPPPAAPARPAAAAVGRGSLETVP